LFGLLSLFDSLQLEQRIAKLAHKTHKERVNEFNAHLESLSEHHDIPKVTTNSLPFFLNVHIHLGWTWIMVLTYGVTLFFSVVDTHFHVSNFHLFESLAIALMAARNWKDGNKMRRFYVSLGPYAVRELC
jgi:hypothetical protein